MAHRRRTEGRADTNDGRRTEGRADTIEEGWASEVAERIRGHAEGTVMPVPLGTVMRAPIGTFMGDGGRLFRPPPRSAGSCAL